MKHEKKLLIGISGLILALTSLGYGSLYKKFENQPHTIREVLRWPSNEIYAKSDKLAEEFKALKEIELDFVEGRISQLEGLKGYSYKTSPNGGRWYYTIKREGINFITLEEGNKFAYIGDFFAGIDDEVKLKVLPKQKIIETVDFLKDLEKFRYDYPSWRCMVWEYNNVFRNKENVTKALIEIPLTKLQHLEGIIENYEIIKDN